MFAHAKPRMHTNAHEKTIQILSCRCLLRETVSDEPLLPANPVKSSRFFQKVDWMSFGVTALAALTVYWFSLPPDCVPNLIMRPNFWKSG
jgi:hypothetical protein